MEKNYILPSIHIICRIRKGMIEVYCQLSWYYSRLLMYRIWKLGNYRDMDYWLMVLMETWYGKKLHSSINTYYMSNQKRYD